MEVDARVLYSQNQDPSDASDVVFGRWRAVGHKSQDKDSLAIHSNGLWLDFHLVVFLFLQSHQLSEQGKRQVFATPESQLHFFLALIPHDSHLDHPRSFLTHKFPATSYFRQLCDLTQHYSDGILRPFKRYFQPGPDLAIGQEGSLDAYNKIVDTFLHGFKLELVEVLIRGFFTYAEDELGQFCE